MDGSEARSESAVGGTESWFTETEVKYSEDDSLDDCMTMLDLAMEKLDRVTQDLYLPESVDADFYGNHVVSANVKSLDICSNIPVPSEPYIQSTSCREEALLDLFSVSDEALLNFVQFSDVFPT